MKRVLSKVLTWLGVHELGVLIGLLIVVAGTWAFIEIADEVLEGETQHFDERVLIALRDPANPSRPIGPSWMAEVGRDITALGGYLMLTFVLVAVAGFLGLSGRRRTMCFLLVAVVGGYLLVMGLKSAFQRPRPDVVPHLSYVSNSSFPSGHSMMSAVVYLTLGTLLAAVVKDFRLKAYFLCVAVLLSALVGASRVYMGVHYPTDVLAGWTAGLVWSTGCWALARRLQQRGQIEHEA